MPGGAQAISRGGAVVARASDAMSLQHNPASLTELEGHHAHYGVDLEIDALCVRPYGYYGWGIVLPEERPGTPPNTDVRRSEFGDPASTAYGSRRLDYVCNSGQLSPVPQLAASFQVHDRVRLALGLVAPVLVTGAQWGGEDGTIAIGSDRARPTPTRYALVHQEVLFALQPSIGAAYRALPWLSFGLGFQVGMGALDNYQVMALRAGTSPSNDMMSKLHASDYFVPSVTLAAYANPGPHWRFGATFNWSEGIDGSGDLTFTTNYYHAGGVDDEFVAFQNAPVKVKRVKVPVPWTATLGARYSQPRPGAADSGDPFTRELWDVELDASLVGSGHVGPNVAEVASDFALEFRRANGDPQQSLDVKRSDLSQLRVDRHGLDVLILRLGGSWNVLPGLLQASAGTFFQSRGVEADYASVDNYGLARVGFGLGAKARLGPVEVMVAYSHVFQETLEVAPPPHEPRDQASDDPKRGFDQRIYQDGVLSEQPLRDPRAPSTSKADGVASARQTAVFESETVRARVVNAGRYTASFNVLSIAVTHRF
jgi:long-chain fatty acid transport protein